MAGGKKSTIGYRYSFALHQGLSRGPVNLFKHVKVGGLTAWTGAAVDNETITIDEPQLFGGDTKEGGVVGTLSLYMGGAAQIFSSTFKALMGGLVPDFRGCVTLFWQGQIASNNPYPKPWEYRVARYDAGWDINASISGRVEPWYQAKALILLQDNEGEYIHAMNPAHIIYECYTNRLWGRGMSPDDMDEEYFTSAANTLCAEMFGLCIKWNRQDDIEPFVKSILSHINGVMDRNRQTGKLALRLIRADYDPDALQTFDYNSGLIAVEDDEAGGGDKLFSEVRVTSINPVTGEEMSLSENNPAIMQANGAVTSTTAAYPGLPTASLMLRVARRDLDMQLANRRMRLTLDRRGWQLMIGDVFKIDVPERGITGMIVRVNRFEDTEFKDGKIYVNVIEDFFGMPAAGYSDLPETSGWSPPDNTATAVAVVRVQEAAYRDLALTMPDGNLAALATDSSLLAVFAAQPNGTALSYDLATAASGEALTNRGGGNWTPVATLSAALGHYDTLASFEVNADLSAAEIGEAIQVGDEIMRIDAVDNDAKTLTIARGCADTIPQEHADGETAWIYEDLYGTDERDYASGETVDVRLLTVTPSDKLTIDDAPNESITLAGRQGRPYPPGDVQVEGVPFGTLDSSYIGEITFTWAHRDRLIQDDRLIEHNEASIGPEAGTTYNIRLYDGATLVRSTTGIAADNWTYDSSMITADGPPVTTALRVEMESERGGLTSTFMYDFFVPRRVITALIGSTGSTLATGQVAVAVPSSVMLVGVTGETEATG